MKKVLSASDLGKLGAAARAKALTPARRREIARNAVRVRWARVAQQNGAGSPSAAPSTVTTEAKQHGPKKKGKR